MPVRDRPALGYFRVSRHPDTGHWFLVLAASEGGPVEWKFRLEPDGGERLTASLAQFLETELVRNVEPVYDDSVLEASDRLELFYSVQEAILDALVEAGQPEFTWQGMANRLDRIQNQLDYLKHLLNQGALVEP